MNPPIKKLLLRFPLCFLAYGPSTKERLGAVTDWCAWDVGTNLANKMNADEIAKSVREFDGTMPSGFEKKFPDHVRILLGMKETQIEKGHVPTMLANVSTLNEFLRETVSKHGRQPYVSIWQKLFWEARKGTGMSYREMSVLGAIISWLGTREKAFIARSVITCRALGYKSLAMMNQELPNRSDGDKPLTQSQLQTTTNRLHERKCFARVRKDPWHTYYSMRLSQDALEKALLGGVTYKTTFHADRKQRAKEFMASVQSAKSGANVNTANVNTGKDVHDVFTERSHDVHGAFTLDPFTLLNSNSLTEPPSTNLKYKTAGTLSAMTPCEGGEKAFNENQKGDSDDEQLSRLRKTNGELMTKREFAEFMKRLKTESGLS